MRRQAIAFLIPWGIELIPTAGVHQRISLDFGWRFRLEGSESQALTSWDQTSEAGAVAARCSGSIDNASWPIDLKDYQCGGLRQTEEAIAARNASQCAKACCDLPGCQVWNWCLPSGCKNARPGSCWIGGEKPDFNVSRDCGYDGAPGWVSRGRGPQPAPAPPRPPSPAPHPGGLCPVLECQPETNDSTWRLVDVPHDFLVEGNFSSNADITQGFLPFGVAWYRKNFTLPASARGKSIWLDFDGVMISSQVFLNGRFLGNYSSGYTPFRFALSDADLLWGSCESNLLAVRADASLSAHKQQIAWYYDGGGIYRHVSLTIAPLVHIAPWGVYAPASVTGAITTQFYEGQHRSFADAVLNCSVEVASDLSSVAVVSIQATVFDGKGSPVGHSISTKIALKPNTTTTVVVPGVTIRNASLWSVGRPSLYSVSTALFLEGTEDAMDLMNTTFGIRRAVFDPDRGFLLNDVPLKILGACNHQDFAGVGVAVPDKLQLFRVAKMKSVGINAWRTAHNPPTVALLDAADQLGMLVWDENHKVDRFDEAEALVRRDRNHPSVIIWSICNEGMCDRGIPGGYPAFNADGLRCKQIFRQWDPLMGRVVSANPHDFPYWNDNRTILDLIGLDYPCAHGPCYPAVHAKAPTIPIIGSEIGSTCSDRGVYTGSRNASTKRGDGGAVPETVASLQRSAGAWHPVLTLPFVSGAFEWSGFDYKGEPVPNTWPDVNSHFGFLDIAGFLKERGYWHRVWLANPDPPEVHLFPHWNWDATMRTDALAATSSPTGHFAPCQGLCQAAGDGQPPNVTVFAFANVAGGSVELSLNGQSLGKKVIDFGSWATWLVPYSPGMLVAQAFQNGSTSPCAEMSIATTGPPASLRASIKDGVGAHGIVADGTDVALIMVEVLDAEGRLVPTASNVVTFSLRGAAARIIGTGNGNPASHTPDKSPIREAFNGLALAVLQSTGTEAAQGAETVTVIASSTGLKEGSATLAILPASSVDSQLGFQDLTDAACGPATLVV